MADSNSTLMTFANLACRAVGGNSICTTLALFAGYIIRGKVACRILYPQSAADTAVLDRSVDPTPSLLPLQEVTLKLFENAKNVDKDPPLATAQSKADGSFEFTTTILKAGIEYQLLAIYKNDNDKLLEEHVLIEKIKLDKMPAPDTDQTVALQQKNQPLKGKNNIPDETESLQVPLRRRGILNAILDFSGKAVIAFDTCMLDVPYINQNFNSDDKTTKSVNIDENGKVSGGILCFPTSMAMDLSYYGQTPDTTETVAEQNFRTWQDEGLPDQLTGGGTKNYKFTYGNSSGGNVWEWWLWENRTARKAVGLTTNSDWSKYKDDMDAKDDFPANGAWKTFWESTNAVDAAQAPYLRRQIGRGWPVIFGTNLTGAGHIILLRGLVIRANGNIHKFIMNNPWGHGSTSDGKGAYDDTSTTAMDSSNTLKVSQHFALRFGMSRDNVASRLVPGTKPR